MSRRLAAVQETRERIAAAAFELHATIGPAQTTIRAIADRAGVQRNTVYHHFPDLASLFDACTDHGMRVTRFPGPETWRTIPHPARRLDVALRELYGYYRVNARLMGNVLRDWPLFSDVGGGHAYHDRIAQMFATLTEGWSVDDEVRPRLRTAIGHAMAFETWRSLTEHGMGDDQAREMMVGFVTGIAGAAAPAETAPR